jgi:type I restriction enzyme M protein
MPDTNLSSLIWSIAELLRNDYKQSEYGKVILPFTLLRRLDQVLAPTKAAVLDAAATHTDSPEAMRDHRYRQAAGFKVYNTSRFDVPKLLGDPDHLQANLLNYLNGFSTEAREIFEKYDFVNQIARLEGSNLLFLVLQRFAAVDLSPETISNTQMGSVFEELIRRFAELSNETAGEHFTPREVITLMVHLLFHEDDLLLAQQGTVRTLYDPCAGTGGMLSVSDEYIAGHNPGAQLALYGQEVNPESYAICMADMLIKGHDVGNIVFGNTLSGDGHSGKNFDYMLANPPFGVDWSKVEKEVRDEHKQKGFAGRFGPGLPRKSDGSLLFLMHLVSKMRPLDEGGSRIGIVLNGSPLFTGSAGSGESEIRRYLLENDLVETIVGLPTDMFFNTGISTYVWILSNKKNELRRGKVQLIDGTARWQKMKKSLGSKRKMLGPDDIAEIVRLHGEFTEGELVRIVPTEEFGYTTVTVNRPLLDDEGNPVTDKKGHPKPDPKKKDTENIPLTTDIDEYFRTQVLPHVPDAWMDRSKDKFGYEIPFARYFYTYEPPRPLEEIDAELTEKVATIQQLLGEIGQV